MSAKVVVIGSNSFAGAVYSDYLLDKGHEVLAISRSAQTHDIFLNYKNNKRRNNLKFLALDLNRDAEEMAKSILAFKPEYVVDYAGQGMVAESWENPDQWYQTNVVAKVKLHQALLGCDSLKKYLRCSTPEIYGSVDRAVTEAEAPVNPSTPYAVSHAAIDMSLSCFQKNYGFPVLLFRSSNFFGPGQQLYRIIPRTIIYRKLGKTIPLHGGGQSQRSFLHIDDLSDATYSLMKSSVVGETYHIATNEMVKIRDLVAQICTQMGHSFEESVEIVDDRPGKDASYAINSDKIRKEFGWKPRCSLEGGIQETIDWVERNFEVIKSMSLQYNHKP